MTFVKSNIFLLEKEGVAIIRGGAIFRGNPVVIKIKISNQLRFQLCNQQKFTDAKDELVLIKLYFLIQSTDKPKFDCDNQIMVAKNEMNFQIRCPVRADPPIDILNFYWSAEGDNKTLESGESDGHYKAKVDPVVREICDFH